ncbi:MAG TPA: hypothetical protein VNG12_11415 [Acidimicrobiales bacterium]|nr:hypothetical protein [Acidimicrobiales bacterium]
MGQGDVPTSRGGPLRRRREKRQLEHLAASSDREGAPRAATAHVKVIEDQTEVGSLERAASEPDESAEGTPPIRSGGFHVHAVPIDQPFGE